MSSDEENLSDEETIEWPDDYFDSDIDILAPEMKNPVFVPQPIGDKSIFDLPLPCLQMILEQLRLRDRIRASAVNTVFREAVATSKCKSGDQLIITAHYTALIHPTQALRGTMARRNMQKREDPLLYAYHMDFPGVLYRHSVSEDMGHDIFGKMQQFFNKLHLKELILICVHLEDDLMCSFNAFIDDSCSFDRLILRMDSLRFLSERTRSLVARAKKDVVIELRCCDVTPVLIRLLERPVLFMGLNWTTITRANDPLVNESFFMEVVRKGHSLEKLRAPLTCTKNLTEVIKIVSSSSTPQKVDVSFGNSSILQDFERYLTAINAIRVFGHSLPIDNDYPAGADVHTFKHGRATIFVAFSGGRPERARVVVTSKTYES